MKTRLQKIAIVGMGAIGKRVLAALHERHFPVAQYGALVHASHEVSPLSAQGIRVFTRLEDLIAWKPDLVAECAGHLAVAEVAPACLEAGIDVVIASIGTLGNKEVFQRLQVAAAAGGSSLILVSGAIGGLDALRSARMAGLESVTYVGTKAPLAWAGTPAENEFDLGAIREPTAIFSGDALQASQLFPKNANVTAAVSLSGVGFEQTRVQLIADPQSKVNSHEVFAKGSFGEMRIALSNQPLPENPKTSWLAALSIEEAIVRQSQLFVF